MKLKPAWWGLQGHLTHGRNFSVFPRESCNLCLLLGFLPQPSSRSSCTRRTWLLLLGSFPGLTHSVLELPKNLQEFKKKQGKPVVLIFCPSDMAKRGSLFKKSSEHINSAGSLNPQWNLVYSLLMLSEMKILQALNQQQQQTSAAFKQKQTTQLVNIHKTARFQHSWRCWGLSHFKINPASSPRKKKKNSLYY